MGGDAGVSLTLGLLSFDQSSLLLCDLTSLVVNSGLGSCCPVIVLLCGAFSRGLRLGGLLLLFKGILDGEVLLKLFNVFVQEPVNRGLGTIPLGEEVRLARHEAEQAIEVVVDALCLLHACHE